MGIADLPVVVVNEARCHYSAWNADMLRASLGSGYRCRVLEVNGEIAGHAILSVAGPEAEILNLCICTSLRGHGLGRAFLRHLLHTARDAGAEDVFLEVRVSNGRARRLYETEGFQQIGERPDYYPGPRGREDGLVLGRRIAEGPLPEPFETCLA
ncbi:ribosomal protein S18-alanine N-acetyltransferase [Thiohalorhabdus methylotrophus]|uniref:[Ribosomal protein bS18]-alanine N-acetyltransferase n=1 Tax=Thiohalorhabdus methylotrophus TaxID=3242694 RepID=A0ABV4TSQ2_9GAMM